MKEIDWKPLNTLIEYLDIHIKLCSDATHDKNWYENNIKKDYDIWILLSGELLVEYNNNSYHMKPNDVFLLYPNKLYKTSCITENYHLLYIHFDAIIGNNHRGLNHFPFDGLIPSTLILEEGLSFIGNYQYMQKNLPCSELYIKGSFWCLLASIMKIQFQKNYKLCSSYKVANSVTRLYPVLDYITNNLHKPIYINDLALSMGLSEKYFITLFKEMIGYTPSNYVLCLKMKLALKYIYEGKYSIKEISSMVGYEDPFTFSKAFKKIYGVAPSQIT